MLLNLGVKLRDLQIFDKFGPSLFVNLHVFQLAPNEQINKQSTPYEDPEEHREEVGGAKLPMKPEFKPPVDFGQGATFYFN